MSRFPDLTWEIQRAPAGAKVAAFFDVDRTLLAGFSAAAFLRKQVLDGGVGLRELGRGLTSALQFELDQTSFPTFVREMSSGWVGRSRRELREVGETVFRDALAKDIYPEARALVNAHVERGHTVAIVSSATRFQTEPLARELGIEHVLCTELEFRKGRFTGEIDFACFGPGKAEAATRLADELDLELGQSFFYTDSLDDLPLLDIVGHPRPLNPDRALAALAAERAWPARTFQSRGRPGVAPILRSALAAGSVLPSLAAGVSVLALNRDLSEAKNLSLGAWGDFGTALAGLSIGIEGEEHLWSSRPAVFLFNHQSALDGLIVAKLVRRDVVGIAKDELRRHPFWGPVFALAGTVFIDRGNRAKAIEALAPAVEALHKGVSIAIAPEGTRSTTARLGPFKKGAFHIAMQAGVPIVPIVLRNAHDALPKGAWFVRPSEIEVVVHPPISTSDWTRDDLDRRIEEIHALYQATLRG